MVNYTTNSLKWDSSMTPKVCFNDNVSGSCFNVNKCSEVEGSPAGGGVLVSHFKPLIGTDNCGCLVNSSWKCQPMKNSSGDKVEAIEKSIGGLGHHIFSSMDNDYGYCSAPKNYTDVGDLTLENTINNATPSCVYPDTAIPTDDQSQTLFNRINFDNNKELLLNYCFSRGTNCPAGVNQCPKALSNDNNGVARSICNQLQQRYPSDYDARIETHCQKFNTENDIVNSGCKCIFDKKQKLFTDLFTKLSQGGMTNYPHCIWKTCIGSDNFRTYNDDLSKPCNQNVSCSSIIIATDNVQNQGTINSNVKCEGSPCNPECVQGYNCNKNTGACEKTSSTTQTNDCNPSVFKGTIVIKTLVHVKKHLLPLKLMIIMVMEVHYYRQLL